MRSDSIIYSVYSFCSVCCFAMLGMCYIFKWGKEIRAGERTAVDNLGKPENIKKNFNLSKNLHDIY